jgi:hypothetical protein
LRIGDAVFVAYPAQYAGRHFPNGRYPVTPTVGQKPLRRDIPAKKRSQRLSVHGRVGTQRGQDIYGYPLAGKYLMASPRNETAAGIGTASVRGYEEYLAYL